MGAVGGDSRASRRAAGGGSGWGQQSLMEGSRWGNGWGQWDVNYSADIPVTSKGRFLRAVTTGPSFLRNRGLLRLSATFCFSLDRNFRFGSEAAWKGDAVTARQM